MRLANRFVAVCPLFLLAAAPITGQTMLSETILDPNSRAVGVQVYKDGAQTVAACSLFDSGRQVLMDVSNPISPVRLAQFNPLGKDQWNEGLYHNGILYTGHRWGTLNAWDVLPASSPFEVASVRTFYHHTGLAIKDDYWQGVFRSNLFYSEHNAFSGPGGLRIYDVTTSSGMLTEIGSSLSTGRDGGNLVVTSDDYVYQLDFAPGNAPVALNVYDVSQRSSPAFLGEFPLGTTALNRSRTGDVHLSSDERYLSIACGGDGARVVNIQNRTNPFVELSIPTPGFRVREIAEINPRRVLLSYTSDITGSQHLAIYNISNPLAPVFVSRLRLFIEVLDMEVFDGRAYIVGRDPLNLSGVLQIWE